MNNTDPVGSYTLVGTIERTNGSGFRLAEHDQWMNFSKFGTPPPMPSIGQKVSVRLNAKGYILRLFVHDPEVAPTEQEPVTTSLPPTRDQTITRLATMNTATTILSSGNRPTSVDDVLALAAQLEAWAIR